MLKRFTLMTCLLLSVSHAVRAESVLYETHTFSTQMQVNVGTSVYVAGNVGELGNWSPGDSFKLSFRPGNRWEGQVALPLGTQVEYKFITRDDGKGVHCDGGNAVWPAGSNAVFQTPPVPDAPYTGKTVFYLSSWANAFLLEVIGTNGVNHAMTEVGPGRMAGEFLFRVDGIGTPGEPLEFVFHDGQGNFDNAPYPGFGTGANNYYTLLDTFWVQDGDVFNDQPSPAPSAPFVTNGFVNSTAANIPGRDIRIYLPRGYLDHTNTFYPVLYMHDGQNVFSPGGSFGSWDADLTATREISQGRMRESILVAIDNNANRLREYLPPGEEIYPGEPAWGHFYVDFVEDNVRPYINYTFRTLTDARNTLAMGSSMGGLISLYMGLERSGWGQIGVMSPAYWSGVTYYDQIDPTTAPHLYRTYLDWGTDEGDPNSDANWDEWYGMYDIFQRSGFVQNQNLLLKIGCGDAHNEPAWSKRLPEAFRYLLPVTEEANKLTLNENSEFTLDIRQSESGPEIIFNTLSGITHTLKSGNSPQSFSTTAVEITETNYPWGVQTHAETSGIDISVFKLEIH